jgi:hypothetical protein
MNYVYCQTGKWYVEIPRGTNRVARIFEGMDRNESSHPSHRRIIEIPSEQTVSVGDSYNNGRFVCQPQAQDKAIEVGGSALRRREVDRLLLSGNMIEALLKKEGLT